MAVSFFLLAKEHRKNDDEQPRNRAPKQDSQNYKLDYRFHLGYCLSFPLLLAAPMADVWQRWP